MEGQWGLIGWSWPNNKRNLIILVNRAWQGGKKRMKKLINKRRQMCKKQKGYPAKSFGVVLKHTDLIFSSFCRFWQYFLYTGLGQHYTIHNDSKHVNNAWVSIKYYTFPFPRFLKTVFETPVTWNCNLTFHPQDRSLHGPLTRVKLNAVFVRVISLSCGCFIFKTRQRWNYNICFTGVWFSARADARGKKQLRSRRASSPRGGFAWYNGPAWVRRDRWPLLGCWSVRAFTSWDARRGRGRRPKCAPRR